MASATPGAMRSRSARSSTVTLETSTAMAGAAVVRSWRTLADCAVSGEALKLQRASNLNRKIQNNLAFADAPCAARAWIRTAMSRIEHNDVEAGLLRLRAKRGGCCSYRTPEARRGRGACRRRHARRRLLRLRKSWRRRDQHSSQNRHGQQPNQREKLHSEDIAHP